MDKAKKRRRRRMVLLIVLVAVLIWVAGCATGRSMSMGLSALVPTVEKGGETIQGGSAPGASNGGSAAPNQGGTLTGVGGKGGSGSGSDKPPVQPEGQSGGGANAGGSGGTSSGNGAGSDGNSGEGNGNANGGNANAGGSKGSGGKPVNGESDAGQQPDRSTTPTQPTQPPARPEHGSDGEKLVALTFDDGPDTQYTTAILDILKDKGIKATFFVVGQQVNKYPEVLQRIADEGHAIGNHTQNHKDLKKQNKAGILEQINLTDQAIRDVLGESPKLFRAPYGSLSNTLKQILKEQGRKHSGWTVDTRDWAGTSVADMRDMIRQETKPNGIILMHSFGGKHIQNTVQALPDIIDDLHKLGYAFVTVDELP